MDVLSAPWATIDDVCGPCATVEGEEPPVDPDVLAGHLLVASEILYQLTGQQWPGETTDTIRPNWDACGCRGGRRGCTFVSEVHLPGYPVVDVVSVTIDGVLVDEQLYRVDDRGYLVWQDDTTGGVEIAGKMRSGWPCCQRQKLPATEVDTFEIVYTYGDSPPPGGVAAAAALGCQFGLACGTDTQRRQCRLPSRVQSITRQGVTMALIDNLELFAEGRTGIPEVDLWVGAILKGRDRSRSRTIDTQAFALRGRRNRRNGVWPAS